MLIALALAVLAQQPAWTKGGTPGGDHVIVAATGSAFEGAGASLTLRSNTAPPSMVGTVEASVSADSFRGRRVRLKADIDARGVAGNTSPFLRVEGPAGRLAFDWGNQNPLTGTASGHREATVYVPNEATRLVFGLIMSGSGEAAAHGLRFEALPPVSIDAPLAPAAQRLLDSAIALVRTNALWRDTVTWSKVEPRVRAIAAGSTTTADVYPAIRALLTSLGDHHSFLMPPDATRQFQTGGAQNPRPEVRALADSIGYISVPAYSGDDGAAMKRYVVEVHDALTATAAKTSCRWIVDLRGNGGGNMWPMLGGLRPFLGEAGLGSFVGSKGPGPLWHARDVVDVPLTPALASLDSAYVAVLTGPRTGSSGEAVTISFIGRPRTRSFGLPTAGLSTANGEYSLPDSSMILLTVSVEADRNGKRYGGKIDPSEIVAADPTGGDAQLARATAWLRAQPGCQR
jgi:hypothetical protein